MEVLPIPRLYQHCNKCREGQAHRILTDRTQCVACGYERKIETRDESTKKPTQDREELRHSVRSTFKRAHASH